MTIPWTIDDRLIKKKLHKMRTNADLSRQYSVFVADIGRSKHADVPEHGGMKKTGRLRRYYSRDLTRSERLVFRLDHETRIIILYEIGDHKEAFGSD